MQRAFAGCGLTGASRQGMAADEAFTVVSRSAGYRAMDGRRLQGQQDQLLQSRKELQDPGGAVAGAIRKYGPRGKDRSNNKR